MKWSAEDLIDEGFTTYVLWDLTRPVDPASDPTVHDALEKRGVGILESAVVIQEART